MTSHLMLLFYRSHGNFLVKKMCLFPSLLFECSIKNAFVKKNNLSLITDAMKKCLLILAKRRRCIRLATKQPCMNRQKKKIPSEFCFLKNLCVKLNAH